MRDYTVLKTFHVSFKCIRKLPKISSELVGIVWGEEYDKIALLHGDMVQRLDMKFSCIINPWHIPDKGERQIVGTKAKGACQMYKRHLKDNPFLRR